MYVMQRRATKLKVECGLWCQKVADSCSRPGAPKSEIFGHEIHSTDLQKHNALFLYRTSENIRFGLRKAVFISVCMTIIIRYLSRSCAFLPYVVGSYALLECFLFRWTYKCLTLDSFLFYNSVMYNLHVLL
jgi:hypothetical protein